ncbi:polymeric immunoglobulin receptor-like isoform X3 [Onychostoma macrolepis]|uniref:polymeric immunoglobulin receptor-like isoform X3 n=1 Tax=Onychostoma macrolepis TaxID=369639 RepID=UPI002729FAC5|nr:polymeric immunoglobulin receptor-like isoform X3 [Onychostoma macrolepis]
MIQICDDKLLIFNLLLLMSVLACETSEILTFTAHERGKVEIRCPYESGYEEYKKYLCRGECPRVFKDKVVESESAAQDERFSLNDNKSAQIFTVTITDLRTEDRGQYWCGVKTGVGNYDYNREIYLEIKHVSRVSGVTGEHLNITCHYESELKDNVKFICKGSNTSLCDKSAIKVSSENNSNGRFSLRDNVSAGVFTVNITDLTEEDSGIYWCGAVQRGQARKNKWISVIDLNISAGHSYCLSL